MYRCNDLNNSYFMEGFECKIGEDILLFGIDGMSYFGKLTKINESGRAILTPAYLSSSGLVEILTPAEIAAGENITSIDLSEIIAIAYDITADPFVMPDDDAEDLDLENGGSMETLRLSNSSGHEKKDCCCESEQNQEQYPKEYREIFEDIEIQPDSIISIVTLGGFLFAGRLNQLTHNTAKLGVEYIFAPGGDGSTLFSVNRVIVNLYAATSFSA